VTTPGGGPSGGTVTSREPAKAPSRVFCARLAGIGVFDPNGDLLGRVRDVVVTLRLGRQAPRVLGLVVEVQRRRIFVPMSRVTTIDVGAVVLASGTLNWRRFEQRPGEVLVLGELLDRQVSAPRGGGGGGGGEDTVTVVDAAMEQTRGHDWFLTHIAVREGRRRRAHVRTVDWDEVKGLSVSEQVQGAASLLAAFEQLRPADLAQMLHSLSRKRRDEVAAALDDDRLADVLEELPEDEQVELLASLEDERAADVLEAMGPDDAADLLGELPTEQAEHLLALMEPQEAAPVRRLLAYADDTAGGLMTNEPIILPPNATVAEALARVRNPELSPALAGQVYVVRPPFETPTGRYLGIAHFQRLLREPPSALVGAVIDTGIDPLTPEQSLAAVTRYLASYNFVAAAVVDNESRLLGAVTVDDVLDHLLPENWRDEDLAEDELAEEKLGRQDGRPGGDGDGPA